MSYENVPWPATAVLPMYKKFETVTVLFCDTGEPSRRIDDPRIMMRFASIFASISSSPDKSSSVKGLISNSPSTRRGAPLNEDNLTSSIWNQPHSFGDPERSSIMTGPAWTPSRSHPTRWNPLHIFGDPTRLNTPEPLSSTEMQTHMG